MLAEEALRESEARYRRLTENARDIIFRYSLVPEMRLTYINPAVQEITGYTPEECYADPHLMLNMTHPEDTPIMTGFMSVLSAPGKPFSMRWIGKDGVTRWMESRVVPVYDAVGQLVAVEGISAGHDRTQTRRGRAPRERSEISRDLREHGGRVLRGRGDLCSGPGGRLPHPGHQSGFRADHGHPPGIRRPVRWASELYGTGQAPFLDIYSKVAETGEPAAFEAYFPPIQKDLYITVGSPGPGRFSTVFSDITERKRAEATLRKSEARFRAVLDATPFPIAVVDLQDNNIHFWSRSALALFGHIAPTASEWYQIAYPDPNYRREVINRWKSKLEIAQQSHRAVNTGEYRVACSDDSVRICELYATFLADSLIVTFNDITDRKQAEAALQESEANLRKAQQVANVGSWVWHIQTNRLEWSEQMYRIFGIAKSTFTGDLADVIARAIHPDDRLAVEQSNLSVISEGKPIPLEYRVIWPDGTVRVVWAEAGELIRDAVGNTATLSGIVQDITERKRAEAQLTEQLDELRRWQDVMLDREDRVQELKREVNELSRRLGQPVRYPSQGTDPTAAGGPAA